LFARKLAKMPFERLFNNCSNKIVKKGVQIKMKKSVLMFTLLVVLSVSGFADEGDGTTHSGGRTCPPNVVCRSAAEPSENPEESVLLEIFDYRASIFG
jgi:hypothetical protein